MSDKSSAFAPEASGESSPAKKAPAKKSIYGMLLKSHLVLPVVSILLIFLAAGATYLQNLTATSTFYIEENIRFINNQLDNFFSVIADRYNSFSVNGELRAYLTYSNRTLPPGNKGARVQDLPTVYSIVETGRSYTFSIFDRTGLALTEYPYLVNEEFDITAQQWYRDYQKKPYKGRIYIQEPQYIKNATQTVSVVCPLFNFYETELIGFVLFDLSQDAVNNFFETRISTEMPILVQAENGEIVYYNSIMGQGLAQAIAGRTTERLHYQSTIYDLYSYSSLYSGWRVTSCYTASKSLQQYLRSSLWIVPVIVLLLALNIYFSRKTTKEIVTPVEELIGSIHLYEKGSFEHVGQTHSRIREIDDLGQVYSGMVDHINALVAKNQKDNLLRVESQLMALQQNINPHFLFNTLEAISSEAIMEGAEETSDSIQLLGYLFRYMLREKDHIPLEKELRHLESYVKLQQKLLGNRLLYRQRVPGPLRLALLPKLTLQPLVENAIKYGMPDNAPLKITLHVLKTQEALVLSLQDNGPGFSPRCLAELESWLENDMQDFHYFVRRAEHMGLRNVNARLCLMTGARRCLYAENRKAGGARVKLVVPMGQREEEPP